MGSESRCEVRAGCLPAEEQLKACFLFVCFPIPELGRVAGGRVVLVCLQAVTTELVDCSASASAGPSRWQ